MKRIFILVLISIFLFSLMGCKKENTSETGNEDVIMDYQGMSETYSLQMTEGNFSETYQNCSTAVKLQMNEKALKQAWDSTVDGLGDYIGVYQITQETVDNYQKVNVILEYENNGLQIAFTYNKKGKIDGLWLNYAPIEEDTVSTEAYEEIKITFGQGDYPITGILTLPKNVTTPPVAILVPGSGTHDVNETVGANKPFRDIAWGLAEQGIASMRYNERLLLYPELAQGKLTIGLDSTDDASEAILYVKNCDKVDAENIVVIGHSLGAMMTPKIATDHPEVAGIVLLAGSPRKLEDISYDQVIDAIENSKDITDKQAKETMASTEEAIGKIRKLSQDNSEIILGCPASYWYSLNQIDTPKLAADLTIPILIAQGSADFQVFADKDYVEWQKLLGGKDNVTFQLYENLNHLFMTSNGKTDITEYNIPGKVDQNLIDDMAAWMKSN